MNLKEIEWIVYYDSFYNGYNMTVGGDGTKAIIRSKEHRKKLSESLKGRFGEKNPFYGHHHSKETINKISESHKGQYISKEQRKKISESLKGRTFSEETFSLFSVSLFSVPWMVSVFKNMSASEFTYRI